MFITIDGCCIEKEKAAEPSRILPKVVGAGRPAVQRGEPRPEGAGHDYVTGGTEGSRKVYTVGRCCHICQRINSHSRLGAYAQVQYKLFKTKEDCCACYAKRILPKSAIFCDICAFRNKGY